MVRHALVAVCLITSSNPVPLSSGAEELGIDAGAPIVPGPSDRRQLSITTNADFITGLYSDFVLEDAFAVFEHVFATLQDHVTVYPSEGYYYFRFPMRGVTVKGALHLAASMRDAGILGFGYTGELEDYPRGQYIPVPGRAHDFTKEDGVSLERVDDWTYTLTFQERTVTFHLHDPGLIAPEPAHLAEGERYLCTSFDESGLRFDLVYADSLDRMFWVLNERGFLPEALLLEQEHVAIGARTGFAFYIDTEYQRKILIGVRAKEVAYNTWYDGPFDQLPDTYIKAGVVELVGAIIDHYGLDPREIDAYGHFLRKPGTRVPIAPYRFYADAADLAFVGQLIEQGVSRPELLLAVTEESGRELMSAD